MASSLAPAELMSVLNVVYSCFDELVEEAGMWKVETVRFLLGELLLSQVYFHCLCSLLLIRRLGMPTSPLLAYTRKSVASPATPHRATPHDGGPSRWMHHPLDHTAQMLLKRTLKRHFVWPSSCNASLHVCATALSYLFISASVCTAARLSLELLERSVRDTVRLRAGI